MVDEPCFRPAATASARVQEKKTRWFELIARGRGGRQRQAVVLVVVRISDGLPVALLLNLGVELVRQHRLAPVDVDVVLLGVRTCVSPIDATRSTPVEESPRGREPLHCTDVAVPPQQPLPTAIPVMLKE